jgi:hypothetical protein
MVKHSTLLIFDLLLIRSPPTTGSYPYLFGVDMLVKMNCLRLPVQAPDIIQRKKTKGNCMAKIHYPQLQQWLDEGLSQAEIAWRFKVNPSSVCKAVRRLNKETARIVTHKAEPAIVDKKIDIIGQIKVLNAKCHQEIQWIEDKMNGVNGAKAIEDLAKRKILQDQMLKLVAEVRKQMGFFLDVAKTLYSAEEVQAFMEEVIKAIEDADPVTKKRIISKLQEARPVRRAIQETESL